ncbi:MAG: succinate dehydrogenase (quinone) flavoprotein subunit, partial [Desulfobacterales bacterium]|nr:succinate dehydrogenase (quinone) flavoprotein subunit [Desulfobacterales bacterium]
FYARGQTGQQLLLGAYSALSRQIGIGKVKMYTRREMMDLVLVDGHARGIVVRNLLNGEFETYAADAVVLATGGYGNVFFLSTNAVSCNVGAAFRAYRKGALFANPCFTQIHPTCIPVHGDFQSKLTLMSESLRNDGRVWVPRKQGDTRAPNDIPESDRLYYLEEKYPAFGNLVPRDVASRNAKEQCDKGLGVGTGRAVYLDFADAIKRDGKATVEKKYGNLFEMYERIVAEDPYQVPMMIYPASHYTMGGLWVDYNLMSNVPGLFVLGEANFSDHGANRLGASALMQGLGDGYFVIPYTIGGYLSQWYGKPKVKTDNPAFKESLDQVTQRKEKIMALKGKRTVENIHREMGLILWDNCGMARNEAGLTKAKDQIRALRDEFWQNCTVPGSDKDFNLAVEKAGRLADFLEFAEVMVMDALNRNESCGCHLREESQTEEGEALRKDDEYCYVAAWEYAGYGKDPVLNKEPLVFENVKLTQRSYK